jgi:hypothetical protein
MSPSSSVELADAVSDVLYALAGWMLVGLGGLGVVVPVLRVLGGTASNPVVPAIIVLLSLCMIAFGVFVNPGFRRRLDRRHSTRTFGRQRTVEHRTLRAEEDRTERCVACDTRTNRGELRRYRTEFCLAGLPFYTTTEGENAYCLDCAADAPDTESTTVARERTDPLTES